jgi:hypothetical protein
MAIARRLEIRKCLENPLIRNELSTDGQQVCTATVDVVELQPHVRQEKPL